MYARKRASQSPFPCTAYHVSLLLTVVNFSWPITVISTCRYQSLFPTRFPRASYSTTSPLLRPCFICIYVTAVSLARNLHPGILTSQYVSRARCFVEINGDAPGAVRKPDSSAVATPMAVIMDLGLDERLCCPECE